MASRFFRRPTDESSSSESEESEKSEEIERSPREVDEIHIGHGGDTVGTESLSSLDNTVSEAEFDAGAPLRTAAEHHRSNLLTALLEDFARNRACELLNNAKPGYNFTRISGEVQPLANSLYQRMSQSLALNGILPPALAQDSHGNRQARATYLTGLESLALGSVSKLDGFPQEKRLSLTANDAGLPLACGTDRQEALFNQLFQTAMRPSPSLTLNPPPSDLTWSARAPRRSHYESSFQQLRLLGKGGFGRVYHTYNLFDKKEYAVKKIPLSPRLSQRYSESGHQELESVLREVQALAQLEHNNIVRYHATWIEEPAERVAPRADPFYRPLNAGLAGRARKLLTQEPHDRAPKPLPSLPVSSDHFDHIVFGADSVSHGHVVEIDDTAAGLSGKDSEPETESLQTSDLFTDGYDRGQGSHVEDMDYSVHVLHVQMSVYPMTLAQYLAPVPAAARSGPSHPVRKHCYHLVPALRILMGILCGLQYVHAHGFIHRDLKPSNIFISSVEAPSSGLIPDGYYDVGTCPRCVAGRPHYVNPRIGDFGLVSQVAPGGGGGGGEALGAPCVSGGRLAGTEYYRPPSFTDGKGKCKVETAADEKIDVFALGVILVEMLWCCATRTERLHVLRALQSGHLPPRLIETICPPGDRAGCGDLIGQCIRGMIDPDPRQRWTCRDVRDRIELILEKATKEDPGSSDGRAALEAR